MSIHTKAAPREPATGRTGIRRLFKRLKARIFRGRNAGGLDREVSESELLIAPFLCDRTRISLDIGADQGSYSVSICNHSADCIAFEPRPDSADLIRNLAIANNLRIKVEAVALSDSAGESVMRILTHDRGRSTIETANNLEDPDGSPRISISVPRKRLDDYKLSDVGFIKIDVEGHELAVLRGAEKTIRSSGPHLLIEIEERHRFGSLADVSAFLSDLGYDGFFVMDGEVLPLAQFDPSVLQDPNNVGGWKDGWERRGVYVNNFFFLTAGGAGVLRRAVSMSHPKRSE
jgi:FkbM family methyltransferase